MPAGSVIQTMWVRQTILLTEILDVHDSIRTRARPAVLGLLGLLDLGDILDALDGGVDLAEWFGHVG